MGAGSSSNWYFKQTYDITDDEAYERAKRLKRVKKKNTKLNVRSMSENGAVSDSLCGSARKINTFSIIHFNDCYEARSPDSSQCTENPGAARFVHEIIQERQSLKKLNNDVSPLVFFSGDIMNPSVLSICDKGMHMATVLNRCSIDCACLGNHEFDFGEAELQKFVDHTRFPWVVSNVVDKRTNKPIAGALESCFIDYSPNLRIGVVGLVEEDWLETLTAFGKDDLIYTDFIQVARKQCDELIRKFNCTFIIALTHMRWNNDERLQRQVPEIDLILGGHDHEYGIKPRKSSNGRDKMPLIIKSGSDFKTYSVIQVYLSESGLADVKAERKVVYQKGPIDKVTHELISGVEKKCDETWKVPLVRIDRSLDLTFRVLRTQENPFGVYIADFMKKTAGADVALINSGTFRCDTKFEKGHLFTIGDVLKIMPLLDRIVLFDCPGHILLKALNNSVSKLPEAAGRFLQVAGIRFKYSLQLPADQRVIQNSVFIERSDDDNEALDLDAVYRVATKGFVKDGKDGFDMFGQCREVYDRDDPRCVILSQALISTYQQLQPESSDERSVSRLIPVIELTNITGRIQTVGKRIQEV